MADLPSARCDCAKVRAGMATLNRDHDRLRDELDRLRAGIQWARGMCTDRDPHAEIDEHLGEILNG